MNNLLILLGIESWKPLFAALLLPPLPFLLSTLVGARMILWRRGWGWLVVFLSVVALWATSTVAVGEGLTWWLLKPPAALTESDIRALKKAAVVRKDMAIIVLGGGREEHAPEYSMANLSEHALARLRYGIWLGRETGIPVGFSGGVGHAEHRIDAGPAEAVIAAHIAAQEWGRPMRWTESESKDTHENASYTVALLRDAGIRRILLVTHGYHMRRALRDFARAAEGSGLELTIDAAPMGLATAIRHPALRWLPSTEGFTQTRRALHEALGLLAGS